MHNNIFEKIETIIKAIVYFCLLLVAACAAAFILYFVAMAAFRLIGLCWDVLFSHNWSP